MWVSLTLIMQAAWTQGPNGQSNCAQISVDLYTYMCFLNCAKRCEFVDFWKYENQDPKWHSNCAQNSKEQDAKRSGFVDSYT